MTDARRFGSIADDSAETPIKPIVAALRVADGTVVDDAAPFAGVLTPPGRVKRCREGEEFFFLFSAASVTTLSLCRELREIVRQTYWSASGSVTAALRRSASVANRYLFEHNLNADRSERCYGGLAGAVLSGRDLFLLQSGPVWSCVLHRRQLRCFPYGEKLAHMGIGPLPDVRLYHVFAALGDTLLLAPYTLLRDADEEGLRRVLSLPDVDSVAVGLEQLGSDQFAALVGRWELASKAESTQSPILSQAKRSDAPSLPVRETVSWPQAQDPVERASRMLSQQTPEQTVDLRERRQAEERRPLFRVPKIDLGSVLRRGLGHLGNAFSYVWHGLAAAGAGVLALGKWLFGAIGATVRSMLPGSERSNQRRIHHHPPPEEDRTIMMAIAVAIPIVILAVVLLAYRQFAAESRLQGVINQATEQIALAQAAEPDSEEARTHWEQALEQVEAAAALQPDDPSIQALQDQAQEALDRFDRIERLTLTQLVNFGSSSLGRRLILRDQMLFVLDREEGWAASVPLEQTAFEGTEVEGGGESEQARRRPLVHTGQQVNGADVGPLVDATWVDGAGGRQSSALLVLGEGGQVVSYDPAWRSESGEPQLSLLELSSPPPRRPVAVASYQGRFYVLDVTTEGVGQIWRYNPQGNAYPNPPEPYFAAPPAQSFEQALDMAIDGHVYILYEDGEVRKFLGGERQPFDAGDIPGGLGEVAGFAVDPEGDGTVYIADRDNHRVVVLSPDGRFQSQFRTEPPLTSLEALAVSQAGGRLYVLAAGRVYRAALP